MTVVNEPTIICTYCQRVLVFRSTGGVTNQAWIDYIPFDEHFCDRACESAWDEGGHITVHRHVALLPRVLRSPAPSVG